MAHHDDRRPTPSSSELVPLSRIHTFRMADGEPDVRGWPVVGADGSPLGRVAELLVDPAASEIAAVLVALPEGDPSRANRAVLPMDRVRIDERGGRLLADTGGLTSYADPTSGAATSAAPMAATAANSQVTREREANGDEVIRVPVVEERLVIEKRPVVTEMLVIRKRAVQTEQVVEADLRRERVEVDQRDFTDDRTRPAR